MVGGCCDERDADAADDGGNTKSVRHLYIGKRAAVEGEAVPDLDVNKLWDVEGLALWYRCATRVRARRMEPLHGTRLGGGETGRRRVWSGIGIKYPPLWNQGRRRYNRSHEADGWAPRRVLDASISGQTMSNGEVELESPSLCVRLNSGPGCIQLDCQMQAGAADSPASRGRTAWVGPRGRRGGRRPRSMSGG